MATTALNFTQMIQSCRLHNRVLSRRFKEQSTGNEEANLTLNSRGRYKRKWEELKISLSTTLAAFQFPLQKAQYLEKHMALFVNIHTWRMGLMWGV